VTSSFANSDNHALPNYFSKPTPDQKDREIEKLRKTVRDLKDQQKATEELFLRAMKMLNRVAQSPGHGLSTKAAKVAHALREEFGELKESIYPYMWF
jgi:translation initiation factor 2 alpha subunit (eIF-2alpha)